MLKSLELLGFKSFADRTVFDFAPGITGVVGPNGSGKSNVVDAVKWILGDQSAKSLRGKEMTDVIFNGAIGRKPSNFAEATLTFDNSSGFLPMESQEVQVGRRLWKSGDAEYLLNGAPVRLKDIRELFMGTGAGSAAYSIIEQGRVDQILQTNASSRRAIFEEAAGISRYKARKIEAERKLERVDQNLLRLTDIVDEVEAQLNSIRNQAVKATKYREISEELRTLWLGLAADDSRHLSSEIETIATAIENFQSAINDSNGQLNNFETALSSLDVEISEADNRLRTAEKRTATNREAIASHQTTVRHQTARKRELDSELIRLRKQRVLMLSRTHEVVDELEFTRDQFTRFEKDFEQRKTVLTQRESQARELAANLRANRQAVQTQRQRHAQLLSHVSDTQGEVAAQESRLKTAQDEIQTAHNRREQLETKLEGCEKTCADSRKNLEDAVHETQLAGQRLKTIQKQQEELVGEQGQFTQSLAQLREQRSAWKARKSVLEDLESRQEGIGVGVKEILDRARKSNQSPWNRIYGSVADLVDVDLEQAALLDVALGNRGQLIVIEDFGSLVEYLNRGNAKISARVGFLEYGRDNSQAAMDKKEQRKSKKDTTKTSDAKLQHFQFDSGHLPDLSDFPGVRNRADALVRCSERTPHLAGQLLADTWIVDTIDVALKLAAGKGRGCRFVTLQGECLDADGTLTVGTIHSETALVSRRSELRRLKYDLQDLDRKIEEEEQRLISLDDSLSGVIEELKLADSNLQQATATHTHLKAEFANHESELQRLQVEHQALEKDLVELQSQEQQSQQGQLEAQMELARGHENVQALQTEIEKAERDIARVNHRQQTLKQKNTSDQLDLAKQEERLNGLRNAFRRLEQDQKQRIQQRDESERRLEMVISQRRKIVLQILNTNALVAELRIQEEFSSLNAARLFKEKDELRNNRTELQKQETLVRETRRKRNDELHREEIQIRDLRHQISALEERMEEEYQLALDAVVDSGVSAIRLYIEEKRKTAERISGEFDGAAKFEDDETVVDQQDVSSTDESEEIIASAACTENDDLEIDYEEAREELEARVNRLRRKLKLMGSVNTDSLRDLDELESRFGHLSTQLQDLVEAKNTLEELLRRIGIESKRLFFETFESIRLHFQDLFRKAFGGGDGDIVLEDSEDVLDCGIDIVARPPGKELKSISLMSGGEKTLTAFALLLAIFRSRPSPYCLLDEVDAALDEANVGRLLALVEEFKQTTQFVVITHKKPTMTIADVLYGVTMEQSGVSKRMSVRFEDVSENGEFQVGSGNAATPPTSQETQEKNAA